MLQSEISKREDEKQEAKEKITTSIIAASGNSVIEDRDPAMVQGEKPPESKDDRQQLNNTNTNTGGNIDTAGSKTTDEAADLTESMLQSETSKREDKKQEAKEKITTSIIPASGDSVIEARTSGMVQGETPPESNDDRQQQLHNTGKEENVDDNVGTGDTSASETTMLPNGNGERENEAREAVKGEITISAVSDTDAKEEQDILEPTTEEQYPKVSPTKEEEEKKDQNDATDKAIHDTSSIQNARKKELPEVSVPEPAVVVPEQEDVVMIPEVEEDVAITTNGVWNTIPQQKPKQSKHVNDEIAETVNDMLTIVEDDTNNEIGTKATTWENGGETATTTTEEEETTTTMTEPKRFQDTTAKNEEIGGLPPFVAATKKAAGATHEFKVKRGKLAFVIQGDKKHTIVSVKSHSPAYGLVMEHQDELVSIDGVDSRNLNLKEVKQLTMECVGKDPSKYPEMVIGVRRKTSSLLPNNNNGDERAEEDDSLAPKTTPILLPPPPGERKKNSSKDDDDAWVDSIFSKDAKSNHDDDDDELFSSSSSTAVPQKTNHDLTTTNQKDVPKKTSTSPTTTTPPKKPKSDSSSSSRQEEETRVVQPNNSNYKNCWAMFCKFIDSNSSGVNVTKTPNGRYVTRTNVDAFFSHRKRTGMSLSVGKQTRQALQWYAKHVEDNSDFIVSSPFTTTTSFQPKSKRKKKSSSSNTTKTAVPSPPTSSSSSSASKKKAAASKKKAVSKVVTSKPQLPLVRKNKTSSSKPQNASEPKNARLEWEGPPPEELKGGWPRGWTKRIYTRTKGGNRDSYWYVPDKSRKFNSLTKVQLYLQEEKTKKKTTTRTTTTTAAMATTATTTPKVATTQKRSSIATTTTKAPTPKKKKTNAMPIPVSYKRYWNQFCNFVDHHHHNASTTTTTKIRKTSDGRYLTRVNVDEFFKMKAEEVAPSTLLKFKSGLQWFATNIEKFHQPSSSSGSELFRVQSPIVQKYTTTHPKPKVVSSPPPPPLRSSTKGGVLQRNYYCAATTKYYCTENERKKGFYDQNDAEISTQNIVAVATTTRSGGGGGFTRNCSYLHRDSNKNPGALLGSKRKTRSAPESPRHHKKSKTNNIPRRGASVPERRQNNHNNSNTNDESSSSNDELVQEQQQQLRAENEQLRKANEELCRENQLLRQRYTASQEELIDILRHENQRLKNQNTIETLRHENEKLLQQGLATQRCARASGNGNNPPP